MQLYNTLTRKKEEFIPYVEGKVGFYTLVQQYIIMLI